MKITDMCDARPLQSLREILQVQVDFRYFNPLRPDSVNVNGPASAETQRPQSRTFQIVPAVS
jgi:hypothetical protein